MKKIYLLFTVFMAAVLFSCDNEDFTGESLIEPVDGVNVTIDASNVQSTYFESSEDTIRVTATLSKLQNSADVVIKAFVTGGDATLAAGEDLEFINEDGLGLATKTIPAKSDLLTATWTIVIHNDELVEGTESISIQFGDNTTTNATVTPVEVTFDIVNYTEGDLVLDMSWSPSSEIFDTSGEALSGTDVADMILTIEDNDGNEIIVEDGAGFETATITSDLADGVYYVKASIFSVINLGDQGYTDLSIDLDAVTLGVSSETLIFPSAVNTECESSVVVLAKITKTGDSYEIEKIGETEGLELSSAFAGTYSCLEPGYGSYDVSFTVGCPGVIINDNFWDSGWVVSYVLNGDGTVTIPAQTIVDGGTPFLVNGQGTYNEATNEMVVDYTVQRPSDGAYYDINTHTFTFVE